MTGYLHIPTDGLEAAARDWIAETFGFSRDVCESAGSDLVGFLRGLSVEPTEGVPATYSGFDTRPMLDGKDYLPAQFRVPVAAAIGWNLLTEFVISAAPVPVQEDR